MSGFCGAFPVSAFLTVLSLLGGQKSKAAGLLLPFKSIGGKHLSSRHTEMDKKHIPTLKVRGVFKDRTASVNHPQGAAAKNDVFSGYPAGSTHLSKSLSALQSDSKDTHFHLTSQKTTLVASEYAYFLST